MSCANPIDAAMLADYWLGLLAAEEEETVELHLLACDGCGDRLREAMVLAEGLRKVAGEGTLRMVVSEEFVRRAAVEGKRVREYALPAGGSVNCTVTAEDDLLISRLAADLTGVERVDLALCDAGGVERARLVDIPVRADGAEVLLQESMARAKAAGSETLIVRLLGMEKPGGERVLGEYTFHHTRTLPG